MAPKGVFLGDSKGVVLNARVYFAFGRAWRLKVYFWVIPKVRFWTRGVSKGVFLGDSKGAILNARVYFSLSKGIDFGRTWRWCKN